MVPRDSETHEFSFRLGPEIFFYFWISNPYPPLRRSGKLAIQQSAACKGHKAGCYALTGVDYGYVLIRNYIEFRFE